MAFQRGLPSLFRDGKDVRLRRYRGDGWLHGRGCGEYPITPWDRRQSRRRLLCWLCGCVYRRAFGLYTRGLSGLRGEGVLPWPSRSLRLLPPVRSKALIYAPPADVPGVTGGAGRRWLDLLRRIDEGRSPLLARQLHRLQTVSEGR